MEYAHAKEWHTMDHHRPARLHYAWVILAVTCLTVVMTAGVTAVPAVLIHPLEVAFGWDRAAIALAVSINVFLYGLAGPFAGRLMLRVGPRRVMLTSLLLIAIGCRRLNADPDLAPPLSPLGRGGRRGDREYGPRAQRHRGQSLVHHAAGPGPRAAGRREFHGAAACFCRCSPPS